LEENNNPKFSFWSILPVLPDKELTMVIIRSSGKLPKMLITNLKAKFKKLTQTILKLYLITYIQNPYVKIN
jgi:hypothetical protein